MINRFNEEFIKFKSRVMADLEEVKSQQDILRISYTINEKQLLEKIKKMIYDDIQKSITGKEHEILMKTWIEELKKIVNNFDELKKLHPKEFSIQIDEISTTIEIFKQKLSV